MDYKTRILISDDSAIDCMSEDDIIELATFDSDWIPRDVENMFADFCPGFERERMMFLEENPELKARLEARAEEMDEKYLSDIGEGDWDTYDEAMTQMSIDFIKENPSFRKYYLKICYFDECENLIGEESLHDIP